MAERRFEKKNDRRLLFLRLARKMTKAVILLENITSASWRLICWLFFFAALWMLNIPAFAGHWGEKLTFLLFLAGSIYFLRKDTAILRKKTDERDIDRRIEQASGFAHRPLSQENDILANPHEESTRQLWQRRLALFYGALEHIRIPRPLAFMAEKDPYALRIGVILLFVAGLIAAGPDAPVRIKNGLTPFSLPVLQDEDTAGITIAFSPPEYTGREQIVLQGRGRMKETLAVPDNSTLKIRVTDGLGHPSLVLDDETLPLEHMGEGTYGLEIALPETETIKIKQSFLTRRTVPVRIVKDRPPVITLNEDQPAILEKGQFRFDITVSDDYGVKDLVFRLYSDPEIDEKPLGAPYTETRPVMSLAGQEANLEPVYDLAWHTWAGLPAIAILEVTDSAGNKSNSGHIPVTLPERTFRHPVAGDLVQERKKLSWTPQAAARESSDKITTLLSRPDLYQDDLVAFLAMRSAASRLYYDNSTASVIRVIETLWDTALRIEEGNISIAARSLREALQALEKTLSDPNASQEDIARAMNNVREAMAAYFTEIAREMQKNMAENGMNAMNMPELPAQNFTPQDLQSFLDQLQAEALSGEKSSAREMLSQLQQMMDGLGSSMDMAMPQDMQFMMDGVSELQQLIDKQEELLALTRQAANGNDGEELPEIPQSFGNILPFDEKLLEEWDAGDMPPLPETMPSRRQSQPPDDGPDTQSHKEEQEALRYILGQLMREADEILGDIPENMGAAELEMRQASAGLERNNPASAIPHQEKAVEYLRQSQQQMSQQLQARMQQMMIFSFSGAGQTDPLGRPSGPDGEKPGWWPGSKIKIPDETERRKVQEIQKMLRDRSGERDRPDYELEYYKRLLKKF